MSNTVVIRGTGAGVRIKVPSNGGSVFVVNKGKSVKLTSSTAIKFVA